MEKRRRKESKKSSKAAHKHDLSVDDKRKLQFLGIDDCISIFLSPQTQRYIGCQIGEQVTTEQPWIYVKKEKIEDTFFLHENSSDFYPIKHLVENYPEEEILIGSYKTNQETIEEFWICMTIEAKLKILELNGNEKAAIIERVKRLIYCQPNKWTSLGSEIEVKGSQNRNIRKLYEVVISSKIPIKIGVGKVRFTYRKASTKSKLHTYDEILPDRRYYKSLIFRMRIDAASQISLPKRDFESQTDLPYPTNKYSQNDEQFFVLILTEAQNQILNKCLEDLMDTMEDALEVNFHINLHYSDYDFPKAYTQSYARESKELMMFHDVINCKDLYYGSATWNSLISGLLAVSYLKRPMALIENRNCSVTDKTSAFQSLHLDNLVLLWCYTDHLSAKIIMHANFEITCVSFCPYDENILVGGGSGGQIVIWDLKNKLKQVESKEYLTTSEINNRNLVRNHTMWMKWPPGVRHVFPTIISDLTMSHKSPVISIEWLPSYHYMTKMGKIENMPAPDGRTSYLPPSKSYQFLTCSTEDSCLLAWEIKKSSHMLKPEPAPRKKKRRLAQLPETLIEGISPLKKFNKKFQPFFKLKLEVPGEKDRRIFVTELKLNNPIITYNALNPETCNNYKERTFFTEIVPINPAPHPYNFVVCSTSGFLTKCDWVANNFDQGQKINEQIVNMKVFLAIHDGPIVSCESNPFCPECYLTVGGSVFGVWITTTEEHFAKAIFWRKGPCRYIAGLWSSRYPAFCWILREDNYLESWDLVDYTTKPIRKTKIKGTEIVDVRTDFTHIHVRKDTFILVDMKGVIRIHDLPIFNTSTSNEENKTISIEILNNMLKRKQHLESLNERLKKTYNLSNLIICAPFNPIDNNPITETIEHRKPSGNLVPKTRATKWQRQEEVRMYETLLQQKRIDVEELKHNTIPLMEKLNERIKQQKRIDDKLALKDEIYDYQKKLLLDYHRHIKRQKMSVSFPIEMQQKMKEKYFEDYKLIEKQVTKEVRKISHRFSISRKSILGKRKTEGTCLNNTALMVGTAGVHVKISRRNRRKVPELNIRV